MKTRVMVKEGRLHVEAYDEGLRVWCVVCVLKPQDWQLARNTAQVISTWGAFPTKRGIHTVCEYDDGQEVKT